MSAEQQIFSHSLANGLSLVASPMPWLESAAFSIYVPSGCRFDPVGQLGVANFACEMVQRGCGDLDSRAFIEKLEMLGVDYNSSVGTYHTHFGGAMRSAQLLDCLSVYADVLQKPTMPIDQLEDGRQVCFQELRSIQDDLPQQAIIDLRLRYYGQPDGRICEGTMETVAAISMENIKSFFESYYRPNETIIAVAGNIDWERLKDHVEALFGDWNSRRTAEPTIIPGEHGVHHIPFDSNQTHIAIAYPGTPYSSDDYYLQRAAVGILSGGVSSRLFSEVREKRGLCYTVFASNHSIKDRGSVICYAGTTSERAQETLDVIIEQLVEIKNGIRQDELDRLKIQIRSGLIMQQESSRSRSGSIAGDWFHLGRVRSLDEITKLIKELSVDSVNQFLAENPPSDFDVVTLGSEPLELKQHGISTAPTS